MEKTCRLVHITYRENNRGPSREEYKDYKSHNSNYVTMHIFHMKSILSGMMISV